MCGAAHTRRRLMERQFRDLWEPITGDQWGLSLAPSIVSPGRTASGTWGARFQQSLAARHRSDGRFVTDCDCGPPHKGRSDAPIDDSHFWTAPGLGSKPDPWATLWTDWWKWLLSPPPVLGPIAFRSNVYRQLAGPRSRVDPAPN